MTLSCVLSGEQLHVFPFPSSHKYYQLELARDSDPVALRDVISVRAYSLSALGRPQPEVRVPILAD
jgi:hypothetical protein